MRSLSLLALLAVALAACDSADVAAGTEVVAYAGPALTPADAVDPGADPWTALSVAPGVRLSQSALCGEGCGETVQITLGDRGAGRLPTFVDASIVTKTASGTTEAALVLDRVEVQDWGPEVISGVAYPTQEDRAPIVFWAETDALTQAP